MAQTPQPGTIAWLDLTVPDAGSLRDFYQAVTGWRPLPVEMEGYEDYAMQPPGSEPVAAICHQREANVTLPPVWLVYITVPDMDLALECCRQFGGKVLSETRCTVGRYAVIEDPAGAALGLYQPLET